MKSVKKIIWVIAIIIINQSISYGQSNLQEETINFFKEYERYASFTNDGLSYEKSFENEFKNLFKSRGLSDNIKDFQIYNDLIEMESYPYVKVREYIKDVQGNYPKGINVGVTVDEIGVVIDKKSGESEFRAYITKSLFALNMDGKIYKREFSLNFLLSYKNENNEISNLEIINITAKDYAREVSGLYLGINLQPAITKIATKEFLNSNNTYGNWTEKSGVSFGGGFEANYYLTNIPYLGIGARLNYFVYSASFELDSFNQEIIYGKKDISDDEYNLYASGKNVTEEVRLKYIEIPVYGKLRKNLYNVKYINQVYVNLGLVFSVQTTSSVETKGFYTYKGHYPEYNVLLYDIPELGFYTNKEITQTTVSNIDSFNMSALVELGLNVPIIEDWLNLNFSFLYQKGFLNLSASNNNYILTDGFENNKSLIDSRSQVKTSLFGVNIGILYKLF